MANFVTDNTPLPPLKSDAHPPVRPEIEVDAADINNLWAALGDVRGVLVTEQPINYVAPFTGAVSRTIPAKLADTISVKDFGAKGDGVADDSAAFSAASTYIASHGGILSIPAGTYLVGSTAFAPLIGVWYVYIRGAGMERTILKSLSGGTVIDLTTSNVYFQRLEIADLTLAGAGPTDVNGGHGLHISTGVPANQPNQIYIHDMSIRDCAGKGLYVEEEFSSRFVNVMVNNCGDNLFDIFGGTATLLQATYAQTVRTGKVGYRIHGGNIVLLSANGINNTWGAANQDQADWGVFGDEILAAWAQSTVYTLGQLRKANGQEYEVITPGTSSGVGTGPATIATDITDGAVHWRHIGAADAVNSPVQATLIGCNVEDPTRSGIRLKVGSSLNLLSTTFLPPPAAPAASAGLIGIWAENLGAQVQPILLDAQSLTNAGSYAQYDQGKLIHISGGTAAIVRLGGTGGGAPSIYHRALSLTYNSPSLTTVLTGNSSATVGYTALQASALAVSGPFSLARVTPTYGATITIDPTLGSQFDITATNATAFTLSNPGAGGASNVGMVAGMRFTIRIINTSGAALGALSFGTRYKIGAAWVQPATGFNRSIEFQYDGANSYEIGRSAADVAN